jgi:hypothetical protein
VHICRCNVHIKLPPGEDCAMNSVVMPSPMQAAGQNHGA